MVGIEAIANIINESAKNWVAGSMEASCSKLFVGAPITQRIQLLIYKLTYRIPSHIFHDRISHEFELADKKVPCTFIELITQPIRSSAYRNRPGAIKTQIFNH